MGTRFEQLQKQLQFTVYGDERKILIQGMARVGSFEQLQNQLLFTVYGDERKILIQGMARVGSFEQLQNQLLFTVYDDERKILLEGMSRPPLDYLPPPIHPPHDSLQSIKGGTGITQAPVGRKQYDVFIAHASEDKAFVTPLAYSLKERGLEVWYDDFVLKIGDSLRREIDKGLVQSRYGVVVLSHNFFTKHWPQKELDGLATREEIGRKVILPIWHNISKKEIISYSPTLADIVAVKSDLGIKTVTDKIIESVSSD